MAMAANSYEYDRAGELKAFDDTKLGVKGLVDSGITNIPPFFFLQSPEQQAAAVPVDIPVIDLSGVLDSHDHHHALRTEAVTKVKTAAETMGFFQVVNHGIPLQVLDEMLQGVKHFHEAPVELKKKYYTRDANKNMAFNSNFDLYQSPAANWRDSIFISIAPEPAQPDELPLPCRDITFKYATYIKKLGVTLFELLSEALGLEPNHLIEIECNKGLNLVGHYYPPCPQPHLTIGTAKHSDPGFITLLLQDSIGGLQIFYENRWADVPPLHGALVVNLGDLLQLITNDKFKSVEHRVIAKCTGPRVSVACFFHTRFNQAYNKLYGPLKELITEDNPPLYKETTTRDFSLYYREKGLDGRSALDHFRL